MPEIKFDDYVRRFKDWALAYQTSGQLIWNPDWMANYPRFQTAVDKLVETMILNKDSFQGQADAGKYCDLLYGVVNKLPPEDRDLVYGLEIPIVKSNCLARLWYGNEELRREPCPTHKGKWGWDWDSKCECCSGCNVTGWLPNQ